MECSSKIYSFGPVGYFHSGWNQFDFFVVMCSLLDIALELLGSNDNAKFLRAGPQLARVLRVLRVSRLFRLVKSLEDL